jgi:hypothetical protein
LSLPFSIFGGFKCGKKVNNMTQILLKTIRDPRDLPEFDSVFRDLVYNYFELGNSKLKLWASADDHGDPQYLSRLFSDVTDPNRSNLSGHCRELGERVLTDK